MTLNPNSDPRGTCNPTGNFSRTLSRVSFRAGGFRFFASLGTSHPMAIRV